MARFAGDRGRILVGATSGAQASMLSLVAKWSIDMKTDRYDATVMGDKTKIRSAGLPDASGQFSGMMDDATTQTYTAAVDGLPRKLYIYPNFENTPGLYFFGMANVDFSASGGAGGMAEFSSAWDAADTFARVG